MTRPDDATLERLEERIAHLMGLETRWDMKLSERQALIDLGDGKEWLPCPRYAHSLDAIHDAERTLLRDPGRLTRYDELMQRFRDERADAVDRGERDYAAYREWHSEAWERAVALDRTLSGEPIV